MQLIDVFTALALLAAITLAGYLLRLKLNVLQRYAIPTSIVAGVIALLLGPQLLGKTFPLLPQKTPEIWAELPQILISIVFSSLFLGKRLAGPREIWQKAGPMVAHGQILAWGQYVVGLTLALVLLTPFLGITPMAGALIEIGFEGGHGTAAGLRETFAELGFEDGADLALALATTGIVTGTLMGVVLVNWGRRRGLLEKESSEDTRHFEQGDNFPPHPMVEGLTLHLGVIATASALGWALLQALIWLEAVTWGQGENGVELMTHIPLFPMAMLGGVFIQFILEKLGHGDLLSRTLIQRVSNTSLDLLIVAAIATLSLATVGQHIWVFIILGIAGIAWTLGAFLLLAPRIFPRNWLPMGLADFGQSIGMTVLGLLLLRMADPENKTGTLESFGYKQLLFEPVVGGGLFTAMSLPLVYNFGAFPVLLGCFVVMVFWLCIGLFMFGPSNGAPSDNQ
ncbi:sodium/glutamate symporter [Aliidiomarina sp. Khilg15.8]